METKQEHTKEPWIAIKKSVRAVNHTGGTDAPNGYHGGICNCFGASYGSSKYDPINIKAEANANRIVQCVNAMAGIKSPNKLIENYKELLDVCRKALPLVIESETKLQIEQAICHAEENI